MKSPVCRFDGIEKGSPLGVRAKMSITLPQSRYTNAKMVAEEFEKVYELYVNSTERGVFGQTFNGYLRTRRVKALHTVSIEDRKIATTVSTSA